MPAWKAELVAATAIGLVMAAILAPFGIDAFWGLSAGGLMFLVWRSGQGRPPPTSHGSARWAACEEIEAAGFLSGRGMVLGRDAWGRLLRMPDRCVHYLCIAPTGAGKNVSVIGPTLLTFRAGSVVILDLKNGENAREFAAARAAMGRRVQRLDVWDVAAESAAERVTLNWLDLLDPDSETLVDDCLVFAVAVVVREPNEHQRFFNDMAVIVLHFLTLFVALNAGPDERSWTSVVQLARNPQAFEEAVKVSLGSDHAALAELAGSVAFLFGGKDGARGTELYSIMSTVSTHLQSFESTLVKRAFSATTLDLEGLRRGDTDLFVCMDGARLESHQAVVRLWLTALLKYLIANPAGTQVLFILDEIAQLGRGLPLLETAITLLRSYGIRLAVFAQHRAQLARLFPADQGETAWGNFEVIQGWGLSDQTAALFSQRLGSTTIFVESEQTGGSQGESGGFGQPSSRNSGTSTGLTISPHEQALMRPEDVALLNGRSIIFTRGRRPIMAQLLRYYDDPHFTAGGRKPRPLLGVLVLAAMAVLTVYLVQLSNRMTATAPPAPAEKPPAWTAPR